MSGATERKDALRRIEVYSFNPNERRMIEDALAQMDAAGFQRGVERAAQWYEEHGVGRASDAAGIRALLPEVPK